MWGNVCIVSSSSTYHKEVFGTNVLITFFPKVIWSINIVQMRLYANKFPYLNNYYDPHYSDNNTF